MGVIADMMRRNEDAGYRGANLTAKVCQDIVLTCGILGMLRFVGSSAVFNMIFGSSASLLMSIFAFYTAAFFKGLW